MSVIKRVALVTGCAQGIGRGIALRLAKDGFSVALNDLQSKRDELDSVADDIEKIGGKALLVPSNVAVEKEVKKMVEDTAKELGGLDVMVANAGIALPQFATFLSTTLDDWDQVMAINARGPFLCYRYAAEQMIKQGRGGRIIGASSILGRSGVPFNSAYTASKFAVRGLTQVAALELGKYNITVNSYAPGVIETPMTRKLVKNREGVPTEVDSALVDLYMNRIHGGPVKQNGQPEDVASIVSYLASKEARLITGQCIAVDGGITLS